MSLTQCIKQAKDFGVWLHERVNERRFPEGLRERMGHSILQHSEDIFDGIIVLLDNKLPGPVWSLARPMFEGYVRGFWLLNHASDAEIDQFFDGKCATLAPLLAKIPQGPDSGGEWIHANCKQNLMDFNGLTHGEAEHVYRRNREGSVEPSYPEQELESVVKFGNEVRIRIGCELFSLLNDEKSMEELSEKVHALRTDS
jgi:hypothetical protein